MNPALCVFTLCGQFFINTKNSPICLIYITPHFAVHIFLPPIYRKVRGLCVHTLEFMYYISKSKLRIWYSYHVIYYLYTKSFWLVEIILRWCHRNLQCIAFLATLNVILNSTKFHIRKLFCSNFLEDLSEIENEIWILTIHL